MQSIDKEKLNKLRSEYKKAGKRYGSEYFNLDELEKRILFLCNISSPNVDSFVKEEVYFYNKVLQLAQQNIEQKKSQEEIKESLDSLSHSSKIAIQKYPFLEFNKNSSESLCYFVGAISLLYKTYYQICSAWFHGTEYWGQLKGIFSDLERLCSSPEMPCSFFLKRQMSDFEKKSFSERNRINNTIFKFGKDKLNQLKKEVSKIKFKMERQSDQLKISASEKKRLCNLIQDLEKLIELISNILLDFRL